MERNKLNLQNVAMQNELAYTTFCRLYPGVYWQRTELKRSSQPPILQLEPHSKTNRLIVSRTLICISAILKVLLIKLKRSSKINEGLMMSSSDIGFIYEQKHNKWPGFDGTLVQLDHKNYYTNANIVFIELEACICLCWNRSVLRYTTLLKSNDFTQKKHDI
ncbi:hypothetical protein BpHYR1_000376 [Brachionus plicatilis]|uniref:Uncharacterized protein n=1 Tax=Brachionus plicatilis TaxID=10195 RepID=A0A3M7Q699_BRAPC|nr:hypothetical protein BpHYR1_000376 [Brachionus plicatilis]